MQLTLSTKLFMNLKSKYDLIKKELEVIEKNLPKYEKKEDLEESKEPKLNYINRILNEIQC